MKNGVQFPYRTPGGSPSNHSISTGTALYTVERIYELTKMINVHDSGFFFKCGTKYIQLF